MTELQLTDDDILLLLNMHVDAILGHAEAMLVLRKKKKRFAGCKQIDNKLSDVFVRLEQIKEELRWNWVTVHPFAPQK